MNAILFYGGFAFSIIFLIWAAVLFFVFRIPMIISYFAKINLKGAVAINFSINAASTTARINSNTATGKGMKTNNTETELLLEETAPQQKKQGRRNGPGRLPSKNTPYVNDSTELLDNDNSDDSTEMLL